MVRKIHFPDKKGRPGSCTTPAGTKMNFKIIDYVDIQCCYEDEAYQKLFQVIRYDDGEYGFRICYYRYNEEMKSWVWGQFTQIISPEEWKQLYNKAIKKGFFSKYSNR